MDGKGRWMDNLFVERLWRSLKYEDVYLKAYRTIGEAPAGIGRWIGGYNTWRPHAELGDRSPAQAYREEQEAETLQNHAMTAQKAPTAPASSKLDKLKYHNIVIL